MRSKEEIEAIYHKPLVELIYDAATVHRMYHNPREVQQATLLSIKTGGCVETCSYCAQSSSWSKDTGLKAEKLMDLDDVYKGPHTITLYTMCDGVYKVPILLYTIYHMCVRMLLPL